MHWIFILGGTAVLVLILVMARATPRGTAKVQGTKLFSVGKVFLFIALGLVATGLVIGFASTT